MGKEKTFQKNTNLLSKKSDNPFIHPIVSAKSSIVAKFTPYLLLALILLGASCATSRVAEPKVGQPVTLKFTAVDGRKVDLALLRGKVVLLYFCASWCPPCVAEFPKVKSVYDKLHPHGFEIIGISLDRTRTKFDDYTKRNKIPWPQHIAEWNGPMMKQFNVRAIPAEILIDQKGNIAHLNARQNQPLYGRYQHDHRRRRQPQ